MGAQEKGERGNEAAGAGGITKGWAVDVREQSKSGVMHELTKGQLLSFLLLAVLIAPLCFAALHKKAEVRKNHCISTQLGDKK